MGYEPHEQIRRPYKKEKKINSKLLALIVLVLVVAIAAFISSSPTTNTKLQESGGISGFLVELSNGALSFDSVFTDYGTIDLNASKTDSLVLKTSRPTNFKLDEEEIEVSDLSRAEITLSNFRGKVKIRDKKVIVDGISDSLYLNTIGIKKRTSTIKMDSAFDELSISNLQVLDQEFFEMGGELTVSDKTHLELDNGKLSLDTFKGSLFVDEYNLTINGLANKISVKNKDHQVAISE